MKSNVKENLSKVLHYSGMLGLSSLISQKRLTIINFHRVVTESEKRDSPNKSMMTTISQFREIIKMVARYTNPIRLSESMGVIDPLQSRSTVITFDDGYADNFQNAYPILKEYNVPATIFLSTRYIDQNREWFWWDEVEYFFKRRGPYGMISQHPSIRSDLIKRINELISIQSDKTDKVRTFIHDLYNVSEEERESLAVYLREFYHHPEEHLMLTWDQVRLMGDVFEIGSHTVNHIFLDILTPSEIDNEFIQSKAIIEKQVGKKCEGICYPAGFVKFPIIKQAYEHGYKYGVTTRALNNSPLTNSYLLNRKDAGYFFINGKLERTYFFFVLSSLYDLFCSLKRG